MHNLFIILLPQQEPRLPLFCSFRPDVAMFVQKVEQEQVAKERGETKDNRSFIAKYVS